MANKSKKYRVWTEVTIEVPIDVAATNKKDAEKQAKEKAKARDYGGVAPPAQVPKVKITSVEELADEVDHEEVDHSYKQ